MAVTDNPVGQAPRFAIIGYAARLPGATDADQYWDLLHEGREAVSEVPPDRWDADEFFDPDPGAPGKVVTRRAGFVDDVTGFDAPFFGLSAREAKFDGPAAPAAAGDRLAGGGAFGHRANDFGEHPHRGVRRSCHP